MAGPADFCISTCGDLRSIQPLRALLPPHPAGRQGFSVGTQLFVSFYLLANGLTKAVLIAGLLRGKLGYYPAAIAVFAAFVGYQLYRYSLTHSAWLILLTLLDLVVIWLTWREYNDVRHRA